MTEKDFEKTVADARRKVYRQYGFRQSSYINFKVEDGYFFCLYFFTGEAILTVKPMYADDLWRNIWEESGFDTMPLSKRGTDAFALSGQILARYNTFESGVDYDFTELIEIFRCIYKDASEEIKRFIACNPDADKFYPDESRMYHDPDRLLFIMALIHNGRKSEALDIIKEARKRRHKCMWQSGWFNDSYTYIRRWCHRRRIDHRILNTLSTIIKRFIKFRAYALRAMDTSSYPEERMFDGSIVADIVVTLMWISISNNSFWFVGIILWITYYYSLTLYIDIKKKNNVYFSEFDKLPDTAKRKWKYGIF